MFIHEAFAKDGNEQNLNVVSEKNERSLSEVLSEVLIKKDFDKVIPIIKYLEETRMKITNKITNKVMKAATDAAAKVAVSNVNSACTFMLHQPKVPALPKRFQK